MPTVDIPFGEWLPSVPTFKNPGCEVADNVIPAAGGSYKPFPSLDMSGDSLSAPARGARQFFDDSANSVIVGGTDTTLFTRRGAIAETTGYSSIGSDEFWDFARFNRFVIATSGENTPQYLAEINSDNTWADLPGTPPQAKRCAKVGDFLMLGSVSGVPNRIQWSAFNNPGGTWETNRQNQSGLADLDTQFGEVQRIVGGRYATIFQERGIQRLSYVGPPLVWRADVIEADRGCVAPGSVASVGYISFFLAQDGFYTTNGSSVQPIGTNRINRWFFDNASQSDLGKVQAAIDWQNEAVIWSFVGLDSVSFNRLIIYSWAQQRWSTATIETDCLVASRVDGVSIDGLDAIYGDLDSIPLSLDDPSFREGARQFAAFVDGEYATFSAAPLQATWETGEAQPSPARRVFVTEVYPLIEASDWDMSVQVLARDNRGVRVASKAATTGWSGFAPVRGEGQKVAIRAVKPAGSLWSGAIGVQVTYTQAGMR